LSSAREGCLREAVVGDVRECGGEDGLFGWWVRWCCWVVVGVIWACARWEEADVSGLREGSEDAGWKGHDAFVRGSERQFVDE
jgi:hypothetical protein